jgi:hypothetical protein
VGRSDAVPLSFNPSKTAGLSGLSLSEQSLPMEGYDQSSSVDAKETTKRSKKKIVIVLDSQLLNLMLMTTLR